MEHNHFIEVAVGVELGKRIYLQMHVLDFPYDLVLFIEDLREELNFHCGDFERVFVRFQY